VSITARNLQGVRQVTVHLRARRKDGHLTAKCVRHHKTPPMDSSVRDLLISADPARVTCMACRIHEVT